jgi:hypothetical protein
MKYQLSGELVSESDLQDDSLFMFVWKKKGYGRLPADCMPLVPVPAPLPEPEQVRYYELSKPDQEFIYGAAAAVVTEGKSETQWLLPSGELIDSLIGIREAQSYINCGAWVLIDEARAWSRVGVSPVPAGLAERVAELEKENRNLRKLLDDVRSDLGHWHEQIEKRAGA